MNSHLVRYTPALMPTPGEDAHQTVRTYAAQYFGASIDPVSIEKLAGDASTRQYYRVRLAGEPSYIVALYPEPIDASEHPTCQITNLFLDAGLPVPRIFDVVEQDGLMLLEDLGDMRLQDWLPRADSTQRQRVYHEAINLILRIQSATQMAIDIDCIAARLAFDEEKLGWELGFFYENFFEKYLRQPLDIDQRSKLLAEFTDLARALASRPRVLCHRDYHSRNLMLHQDRLFIIDHQDARMGPASYDLASLLGDPYVALDLEFREELMDYYLDRFEQMEDSTEAMKGRTGFEAEYQLMLIQRLLKATGTYAYQTAVVGTDLYRPYIPRSIMGALEALHQLNQFPSIRSTLEGACEQNPRLEAVF